MAGGGLALVLTLLSASLMSGVLADRDRARFDNATLSAGDRVNDRMEAYTAALRGVAGLFASSERVTLREFRAYVDHLSIQDRYPGIQGVGYARRARPGDLPAVLGDATAQHGRAVEMTPPGPRDEYFPIVYIEPLDARNLAALGYDMFADSVRREAMERARDTGQPALSGRVRLMQEIDPQTEQAGFLIYLPVYAMGDVPQPEARAAALEGFVYSPFRADDLFEGIFGAERPRVAFRVYDGESIAPHMLLHDSDPAATAIPSSTRSRTRCVSTSRASSGRSQLSRCRSSSAARADS